MSFYAAKQCAENLKAKNIEMFFSVEKAALLNNTESIVDYCNANNIPLIIYCPNTEEEIKALPDCVVGVCSDKLVAKDVLYNAYIE